MDRDDGPAWDLDSILPGGPGGPAFLRMIDELSADLEPALVAADTLGPPSVDPAWDRVIPELVQLETRTFELWSFALCHAAADTSSSTARLAEARLGALGARLNRAWAVPTDHIGRCDEDLWRALLQRPQLAEVQVRLETTRAQAAVTLPLAEQILFADLEDDAFHSWGQRYRQISGRLHVHLDGEKLSVAQARNRMETPDRKLRHAVADATREAWASVEDDCASTLSPIIGIRRTLNQRLGIDELTVPLIRQRIHRDTLSSLREACRASRPLMWRYIRAKARLLGQDKLHSYDMMAPIGPVDQRVTWSQARQLVVDQVTAFSPDMGAFFSRALRDRWVEAQDRPGKRAGAFCAGFPSTGQSRVFMTFGGGPNSVRTLAHELGHAYHNQVLSDLPPGQRALTSCLAETASTFAETVVRQAMLDQADTPQLRLALLDRELAEALTFLCQLMVRFDFERELFTLRARGPLQASQLTATMERLQRDWYGDGVGQLDGYLWASKLHFYLTRAPFYNFSYTFGYLFSGMVHRRARQEGPQWADTYRDLLRDTRQGMAEPLAQRYLGVDLRQTEAWLEQIASLEPLVQEFEAAA